MIKSSNDTSEKDTVKPVIKNIKNKKTYNKKKVVVYIKDNVKLKKVTVNNKKVKLKLVKKGKYKGYYKFTVKQTKKNKKYKIVAIDSSYNKTTKTFKLKKK